MLLYEGRWWFMGQHCGQSGGRGSEKRHRQWCGFHGKDGQGRVSRLGLASVNKFGGLWGRAVWHLALWWLGKGNSHPERESPIKDVVGGMDLDGSVCIQKA